MYSNQIKCFFQKRILMIVLQCFGPIIFTLLVKRLQQSLESGNLSTYLRPQIKKILQNQILFLKGLPSFVLKLHLASFYLGGPFYHLSKRVTGIKYVSI